LSKNSVLVLNLLRWFSEIKLLISVDTNFIHHRDLIFFQGEGGKSSKKLAFF